MLKMIKDIFTEDDGESVCIAKTMAMIAFCSFIGYAGYGLYKGHFDLTNYANGIMQVLAGAGAVIGGKQLTQKKE